MSVTEEMAVTYARRVGERLRSVRRQQRLSLHGVESASGQEFRASVLGAYERGERSISVPRLQRLAKFYNVPVDQLLPRDLDDESGWSQGQRQAAESSTSRQRLAIDLVRLARTDIPERDVLSRYVTALQVQRQDFNREVITLREDDLRLLASMFGEAPSGFRRHLQTAGLLR